MVSVAYLVLLFLLALQLVRAQPGFVNIQSCATSEYSDPHTNITYKSDDYLFNNIGTCYNFSSQSSRFFANDSHDRWCYSLPVIKGQSYITRFTFLNVSSLKDIDFKISIDTTTISHIESSTKFEVVEGTFVATRNYTNLCLLKGSGNAYISKIELRPLNDSSYLHGNTSSVLKLMTRVDLGNKDFAYRYPIDSVDRIWSTITDSSGNNMESNKLFLRNANSSIPIEVLQTASSNIEKLQFICNELDTKSFDMYLIILYLSELNSNVKTGERVFDLYLNGERKFEKVDILQGGGDSNYREIVVKIKANGLVNISLVKVTSSKYGPICSAYEIFKVYQKATETRQQDLDALNKLREELAAENLENTMVEKLHGDPCMFPPWEGLTCKEKNGEFVITELDFTLMKFHGPLPSAIGDLADLESIICDPNISCQLPTGLSHSNDITIETIGAPGAPSEPSNHHVIGTIAGGSVAFSIALGMIFTCFYKCSRPNRKQPPIIKNVAFTESSIHTSPTIPSIKSFSLQYIEKATCHYSTLIGEGGFGSVFRGTLPHDEEVAVKVRSATSTQGTREFNNEVTLLSKIRHDNLVPLLGYCSEKDQQILVYPFMSNGSLQDRLYGEASKRKVLDWATRLSIALGAARGLAYLHSFGGRCIIHRDVKSSNILLDQSMSGKVADFGFSKYAPQEGDSVVSLEVRGTAGYLDPEYYSTQQLSAKSDVFSFGVVLLEIITGREPLDIHRPRDEWSLVEWAKPYIRESKIEEIVDPNVKGGYHAEAMWRVVEAALACIEPFSTYRPNMVDIVRELEDALIIENNASEYMRSIESNGGSNRYVSIERKIPTDSLPDYCEIPRLAPR